MTRGARASRWAFYGSSLYIILLAVVALAAPLLAPHSPTSQDLDNRFQKPELGEHLLGTDNFGRDVFSRILYGTRPALFVGIISVSIALIFGLFFGLTAALSKRWVDSFIMLCMDGLLSFPTVLLAIVVVTFFGYGLGQVMVAIGVIFCPVFARLVRAEALVIKTEGYLESSRALGTPLLKSVILHYLPNMVGKIVVQCAITFALSVVIESSLSYLGLGTQPPNPSWGLMLKDARTYLTHSPWLAVFPGLAIALTVLSFNILGDSLSDKWSQI